MRAIDVRGREKRNIPSDVDFLKLWAQLSQSAESIIRNITTSKKADSFHAVIIRAFNQANEIEVGDRRCIASNYSEKNLDKKHEKGESGSLKLYHLYLLYEYAWYEDAGL